MAALAGNSAGNALKGTSAQDWIEGFAGNDTLRGGGGDDWLFGGNGDDRLYGEAGNDSLDGGSGSDHMAGGAGDDSYYVNATGDVVAETISGSAGGTDIVYAAVAFTLGANIENLRLYKTAASGTGNALDNHIQGSWSGNVLSGLGGNDTLLGGDGADHLLGGDGDDTLAPTILSATWTEGGTPVTPAFGGDTLDGGAGTDTAVYPNLISEDGAYFSYHSPNLGIDLEAGTAAYADLGVAADILISIENVKTGNGNDTIVGSGGDNVIDAGAGYNTVYGGGGDDHITVGGSGNPPDGGSAWVSRLFGGDGDDVLQGNGNICSFLGGDITRGTDYLSGGDGDDILWQGDGNAVMNGGAGADEFRLTAAVWHDTGGGPTAISTEGTEVTILDFDSSEGDQIVFAPCDEVASSDGFEPATFQGANTPGVNEIGYTVQGGNTIVSYCYATDDMGDDQLSILQTVVLEDFTGKLTAGDFDFI